MLGSPHSPSFSPPQRCGFPHGSPRPPLLPLPPHKSPSQELSPCGAAGTAHNPDPVGHPSAAGCVSVPPAPSSPLSGLRCSGQRPPALELLPPWLPHQRGALPELGGLNHKYLAPAFFWQRPMARGEQLQHRHLQRTEPSFPSLPTPVPSRASRPYRRAAEPPAQQCQQPFCPKASP